MNERPGRLGGEGEEPLHAQQKKNNKTKRNGSSRFVISQRERERERERKKKPKASGRSGRRRHTDTRKKSHHANDFWESFEVDFSFFLSLSLSLSVFVLVLAGYLVGECDFQRPPLLFFSIVYKKK